MRHGDHAGLPQESLRRKVTNVGAQLLAAERSQHRNKDAAMKILMSRLYMLKEAEAKAKTEALAGAKKDIDFGSQIRSYVLQPYQMVKDLRTEVESGNVAAVLDGDLDLFMEGYLRWRREQAG